MAPAVTTPYTFLYRRADEVTWHEVTSDGHAPEIVDGVTKNLYVGHSRGAVQATRDVVRTLKWLQEIVEQNGAEIWPIPERSRNIYPARLVRPEPIIKVG